MIYELGLALSGVATIFLATMFFYFPWQSLVIDQTRQRLFEIRDKWFDYTQNLTSNSDKQVAALLRAELNYMIRLLHHFTLPVIAYIFVVRLLWDSPKEGDDEIKRITDGFEMPEASKEAKNVFFNALTEISWCIARRSLVVLLLLPVFILVIVIMSATIGGAKNFGFNFERLVATLAIKENRKLVLR